jgi:hypothetical protein
MCTFVTIRPTAYPLNNRLIFLPPIEQVEMLLTHDLLSWAGAWRQYLLAICN